MDKVAAELAFVLDGAAQSGVEIVECVSDWKTQKFAMTTKGGLSVDLPYNSEYNYNKSIPVGRLPVNGVIWDPDGEDGNPAYDLMEVTGTRLETKPSAKVHLEGLLIGGPVDPAANPFDVSGTPFSLEFSCPVSRPD